MSEKAENGTAGRVTATPAARGAIAALCAAQGGPVMFVQSGGCCDGSDPMCFEGGEFALGAGDLLVGEIDGCTFHVDADQYERSAAPPSSWTSKRAHRADSPSQPGTGCTS
ncbi:DUF779 domain-containing protein [Streptomyces sp. SLBN-31]|uniref:DUF779 domain-containing protein n=1 Tax=Streptomyces sp. SLBN-31 TaxID=2768444 RepID=UPI00116F3CC4|nr:DUF779 domain-containing protein [Streptomyces sp. SLBN-31]TQJ86046.1 uncharacterized protein DUF779 [Streptomyces sp. SLBN-31]